MICYLMMIGWIQTFQGRVQLQVYEAKSLLERLVLGLDSLVVGLDLLVQELDSSVLDRDLLGFGLYLLVPELDLLVLELDFWVLGLDLLVPGLDLLVLVLDLLVRVLKYQKFALALLQPVTCLHFLFPGLCYPHWRLIYHWEGLMEVSWNMILGSSLVHIEMRLSSQYLRRLGWQAKDW